MKGYSYPLICPISEKMCIRERCPKDEECSHKRKRLSDKEFKEVNEENKRLQRLKLWNYPLKIQQKRVKFKTKKKRELQK
jgi:hypothetical protein